MGNATTRRTDWGDRFLQHVDDSGDCWLWTGALNHGYGWMAIAGTQMMTHRVSYLLHHGDLPDGAAICHHCDNPPCVNPEHLYAGDQATNVADMVTRERLVNPQGEAHGKARLTVDQVRTLRSMYAEGGATQVELSAIYGINQAHISRIIRRKAWNHA